MEKLKEISASRKLTWFLLAFGMLIIFVYYFRKVPMIYSVWELVDEFGYLANAAYLSGNKWPYVTNYYYGYGYSLWLIPLFWFCNSGIAIIRGAITINAVMVAALFLVQYGLISKICKQLNRNMAVIVSFILCFYPYIVASELKVLCEVLVTLLVWVCGLLFYQALDTGKWYYYVLLAFLVVYMFFVHTRTLVFGGVLVVMALALLFFKKIHWKQLALAFVTALAALIIGFAVKNQVIHNVYIEETAQTAQERVMATVEAYTGAPMVTSALESKEKEAVQKMEIAQAERTETKENKVKENKAGENKVEENEVEIKNTLPLSYIIERILRVFENFSSKHLYGLACKLFYLFVGTCGMFYIGVFAAWKDAFVEWKETKKLGTANVVKVMFVMAALMGLLATSIQTPYSLKKPAYNFYGRYYEYIIGPMILLGVDYSIRKKISFLEKAGCLFLLGICYMGTLELGNYLKEYEMYFDSCRMPALSYFVYPGTYNEIIKEAAVLILFITIFIMVLNYGKRTRKLIPFVVMFLFASNNRIIVGNILHMQTTNAESLYLVTHIQENYDVDDVYFLNKDFEYPIAYAELQSLLGKDRLIVLDIEEKEQLQEGDIFVSFCDNPYVQEMEHSLECVYTTTYYQLYEVQAEE